MPRVTLPTTRFTITPAGPTAATITFDPAVLDVPSRWQLERITTIPNPLPLLEVSQVDPRGIFCERERVAQARP